jgi:DNA-binding transcriptional ArsR family regulator
MEIDIDSATVYAGWFKCLSDPTRVIMLNRLATAEAPMSVGELVALVHVGQPTVSHHLRKLADVGFVLVEPVANKALYRVNHHCLAAFPSAAELVMGKIGTIDPAGTCVAPWMTQAARSTEPRLGEVDVA